MPAAANGVVPDSTQPQIEAVLTAAAGVAGPLRDSRCRPRVLARHRAGAVGGPGRACRACRHHRPGVPFAQSQAMRDALDAAGVPVELVPVPDADHIFAGSDEIDAIVDRSVRFLRAALAVHSVGSAP